MYLFILNGMKEGYRITLTPGVLSIGRSAESIIALPDDKYVSSSHAELHLDSSGLLTLHDLGSRNGTFLLGDIVGSSHIAQAMGDRVADKVKNVLLEKLNAKLQKNPADFVKNTGDGYMIIFSNVRAAIKVAMDLLMDMGRRNRAKAFISGWEYTLEKLPGCRMETGEGLLLT